MRGEARMVTIVIVTILWEPISRASVPVGYNTSSGLYLDLLS